MALKGIPRDSYRADVEGDDARGRGSAGEDRRAAQTGKYRIFRYHAAALAARGLMADRQRPLAGRNSGSAGEEERWWTGASVHGLPALRQVPGKKWLEIAMIRMNHKGTAMDAEDYNTSGPGNVTEVVTHVKQARQDGMGVISMKLVGEGGSRSARTARRP